MPQASEDWPEKPNVSSVYASQEERHRIAAVAWPGLFCEVQENEVYKTPCGIPVLKRTKGIDKWKEVDGKLEHPKS